MVYTNEDGNPSGYLNICKNNSITNYLSRFAIIKKSEKKMYFYHDDPKNLSNPAEFDHSIDLRRASMVGINTCMQSSPFAFYITIDGKDNYFKAKNEENRDKWITFIKSQLIALPPMARPASWHQDTDNNKIDMGMESDVCVSVPEGKRELQKIARGNIIKEGLCNKVGDSVKNWKSRWFILDKNGLSYYKPKEQDTALREINYKDIIECRKSNGVFTLKDDLFEVVTADRVYYIQGKSPSDVESWIKLINENKNKHN